MPCEVHAMLVNLLFEQQRRLLHPTYIVFAPFKKLRFEIEEITFSSGVVNSFLISDVRSDRNLILVRKSNFHWINLLTNFRCADILQAYQRNSLPSKYILTGLPSFLERLLNPTKLNGKQS